MIAHLMPKFVTLEEVPDFLSKTLLNDCTLGRSGGNTTVPPSPNRPTTHPIMPVPLCCACNAMVLSRFSSMTLLEYCTSANVLSFCPNARVPCR